MSMIKISALLGFLLYLCSTSVVAATSNNDPLAPVNAAYRLVTSNDDASPLDPPHRDQLFSTTLATLIKADGCTNSTEEARVLDYDPFLDAQDGEVKHLSTQVIQHDHDKDKATVEAKFVSFGNKKSVLFDVVLERGAWRISDIHTLNINDERDSLLAAFKEAYPDDASKQCDAQKLQ